jgi:hypothetical protein
LTTSNPLRLADQTTLAICKPFVAVAMLASAIASICGSIAGLTCEPCPKHNFQPEKAMRSEVDRFPKIRNLMPHSSSIMAELLLTTQPLNNH